MTAAIWIVPLLSVLLGVSLTIAGVLILVVGLGATAVLLAVDTLGPVPAAM